VSSAACENNGLGRTCLFEFWVGGGKGRAWSKACLQHWAAACGELSPPLRKGPGAKKRTHKLFFFEARQRQGSEDSAVTIHLPLFSYK